MLGNPAKDTKKPANACVTACDDYDPVCARAKNSSKERLLTFGSKCVMNNYNCQHADDRKPKLYNIYYKESFTNLNIFQPTRSRPRASAVAV